MKIENAKKEDARELAYLINLAGEGIPEFLWSGMEEGSETPLDVGARRASRDEGGFSYRNARIIRQGSLVSGLIISYQLDDPYVLENMEEYPEVVRPLVLLESEVPGSWYVNAIATKEEFRGQGVAKCLLQEAEQNAINHGIRLMSLIVASENTLAKGLYLKTGYESISSLPVVDYPGSLHAGNWELMAKDIGNT
jgi:ribosomal protein S18 acetylase RimI-like enzyme